MQRKEGGNKEKRKKRSRDKLKKELGVVREVTNFKTGKCRVEKKTEVARKRMNRDSIYYTSMRKKTY